MPKKGHATRSSRATVKQAAVALKSTNDAASYLRRKAQKNEGAAKILAVMIGSRVPKRTRRFDESDDEVLAEAADGGSDDDDSGDDDGDESDDTKPERVGHL